MSYSTAIRNFRDGALVIKDGAGSPNSCTVVCDGNFSWTVAKQFQEIFCRGVHSQRRKGEDIPCKVSFEIKVSQLLGFTENSSDPITPYEILQNVGSTFTSTTTGIYAVDLEFTISDPDNGTTTDEKITFSDFSPEEISFAEGDENMLTVSGTMIGEAPTIARV